MIKLRMLMGDYPRFSRWARLITGILLTVRQEDQSWVGEMMVEEKVGVMWGKSQESRMQAAFRVQIRRQRMDPLSGGCRRNQPSWYYDCRLGDWFQTLDLQKCEMINLCSLKWPEFAVIFYSNIRTRMHHLSIPLCNFLNTFQTS